MLRCAVRSGLLVALSAAAVPAAAQEEREARPAGRTVSGDGRGMATFGDRGLTTFGERFGESFGRRDLERFSDIPLAPMGGLEVAGASERRASPGRSLRSGSRGRPPRGERPFSGFPRAPTSLGRARSVASIHGVPLAPAPEPSPTFVLPAVPPPVLTLDHAPALAVLSEALREEIRRAERRGDLDAARSLAGPPSR